MNDGWTWTRQIKQGEGVPIQQQSASGSCNAASGWSFAWLNNYRQQSCRKKKETSCKVPFILDNGECKCPAGSNADGKGGCRKPCDSLKGQKALASALTTGSALPPRSGAISDAATCALSGSMNTDGSVNRQGGVYASCAVQYKRDFTDKNNPQSWAVYTEVPCNPDTRKVEDTKPQNHKSDYTPNDGEKCETGFGEITMGSQRKCIKNGAVKDDDVSCPAGTVNYYGECKSPKDVVGDGKSGDDESKSEYCKNNPLASNCVKNDVSKEYCKDNPDDIRCIGSGGNGDSKDESDFCKANPTADQCQNKSEFGGACGGFTCKGDAVQCAIALEQHKRNCELFDKDNAFYKVGDNALSGNDKGEAALPSNSAESRDLSGVFNNISDSEFIGNATCPAPKVITYTLNNSSHELIISYDSVCLGAQYIRYLLIVCAWLVAARIFFGGSQ